MDGASMIIAVGGDGTINEVVNGFFLEGEPLNPLCELGIINCGTGGGFARTLNIQIQQCNKLNSFLSREYIFGSWPYYMQGLFRCKGQPPVCK